MAWSSSPKSLLTVFVFTSLAVSSEASATNQTFKQKGCSKDPCSELEFSATLGDQRRFSFVNRCCTSDNCNKDNITLPQASEEANGIQCLAYYEEPGTQGILSFLNCTGNETKCVAVIGTAAGSSHPFAFVIAGMGCVTESACNRSITVLNSTNILTFCSRSSMSLKVSGRRRVPDGYLLQDFSKLSLKSSVD
ncbi:protein RoBo-1-like [Microtus ochrogaster]|uniref:Protein RoBo-1-like n=1 Tax=Microtus ochrogaster TaxID=79684 RepID=A0ABM1AIJ0_MICOH|nr:protein RoBo-1-like [Microtus ochrogaster]